MKSALLFLFLLCNTLIKAQNQADLAGKRIDTIHSAILNEDRYIWVHVPDKATVVSKYPVIYILDGQILFDEVNNILDRLSKETGKNTANEMIVVGIGNIWQRYRDYSPTHVSSSPWIDDHTASISGGGEKFISFLENELFPYIHSKYPDSSLRILIGHSMGGLAVMNILLKHPDMFNYYAAIDPSMWWDNRKRLDESKTILESKIFENKILFLAVANTKDRDMDVPQIKKDTSEKTVLIRPSLTLIDYINNNKQNKLRFGWRFYKENHHMTVPAPAMYYALKLFLKSR
ncbi:MAG: alpha/beta hydrolase [Flavisolibacter sp.]|nr:alpha/beta hydrolase [Flavisolibacter sp.]